MGPAWTLWRWRGNFARYWAALTISGVGSGISLIALPILAAEELRASSLEVGYLRAAETVPYLLLAILVGALVDRSEPRRLMIIADLSRAVLMALIPILLGISALNFTLLLVIAGLSGSLTVLFDVAQFRLLPELVAPKRQTQANATLELTRGATATSGPGIGGFAIGSIGPALAVLFDAFSFLVSIVFLSAVRLRSAEGGTARRPAPANKSLSESVSFLFRNRLLRPMTLYLGVNNLLTQAFITALIAGLEIEQKVAPAFLGIVLGSYGAGFMTGAIAAPRMNRFGAGRTVIASSILGGTGITAVGASLLAFGPANFGIGAGAFAVGVAGPLFNVPNIVLRLTMTPSSRLGSITALVKLISQGALALGAVGGGAMVGSLGSGPAFFILGGLSLLATIILILSPINRISDLSSKEEVVRVSAPQP